MLLLAQFGAEDDNTFVVLFLLYYVLPFLAGIAGVVLVLLFCVNKMQDRYKHFHEDVQSNDEYIAELLDIVESRNNRQ